jgi:hypothetical protein
MTPEERTVDATLALLRDGELETVSNFYSYFQNDTAIGDEDSEEHQEKPCVIVEFIPREEAVPQTGIIVGDLVLTVVANSHETTAAVYAAMKGEVYNFIYTADLPSRLTDAIDDFHCYGFAGAVDLSHRLSGEDCESTITIPLAVYAAAVPAS